jgi:hypothetical protein
MRASRIGFILCRLSAAWLAVWFLPAVVSNILMWFQASREYRQSYALYALYGLAVLLAASIVWGAAGWVSEAIVGDDDDGGSTAIDAAQLGAIGFAFIGSLALVYSASGLTRFLAYMFNPVKSDPIVWVLLAGNGGESAPVTGALGVLFLCFAPRLGIWLENTGASGEGGDDDPA